MNDNVVDFESRKQNQLLKRKEAKVDALRKAFRLARGEPGPDKPAKNGGKRGKTKTK